MADVNIGKEHFEELKELHNVLKEKILEKIYAYGIL